MVNFGPLAAQRDQELLSYFHVTKQASDLVDFSKERPSFIYVARPGSGKTALVKWLQESNSRDDLTIGSGIKPMRGSSIDPQLNALEFSLMLTTELFTAVISEITMQRQQHMSAAMRAARKFIDTDWKGITERFFGRKLAGISIVGSGFTLHPTEQRNYLDEIIKSGQVERSRTTLQELAAETKTALVVDDPELIVGEGLNDVTVENARRLGIFLSSLAELHSLGIRVIVFLKEHILQNTRAHYRDFPQFIDQIEGLEWTDEDLVEMLDRRVEERLNTTWEQVFDFTPDTLQEHIFPYLVNGPRDLLYLCNIAGRESGKISTRLLEKGLRVYKADKEQDLRSYYGEQWSQIDQFALTMVDALKRKYPEGTIPISAVNDEFEAQCADTESSVFSLRKTIDWVNRAYFGEQPHIDERLFIIGCLGYVIRRQRFYPWTGRDVDRFILADSHFISPAFAE